MDKSKSAIQSVIIPKSTFSKEEARQWAKVHGYKHRKVDETEKFYRFRQIAPKENSSYYTVKINNGIEFIFAYKHIRMPKAKKEIVIAKDEFVEEHKNLVKILKEDKPTAIKAEMKKQSQELQQETKAVREPSEAQKKHRANFAKWAKSKSGKTFKEWLSSQ